MMSQSPAWSVSEVAPVEAGASHSPGRVVCRLCGVLVGGGAFEDLHDVVTAFVPFKLRGDTVLFDGEDGGEGIAGHLKEADATGLLMERREVCGELLGGEELERQGRRGLRVDGTAGESETGGGERGGAEEVAASWGFEHGGSGTQWTVHFQVRRAG
jgi:hypothetical protein